MSLENRPHERQQLSLFGLENLAEDSATTYVEEVHNSHSLELQAERAATLKRRADYLKLTEKRAKQVANVDQHEPPKTSTTRTSKNAIRTAMLITIAGAISLFGFQQIYAARLTSRANNYRFAEDLLDTVTDLFCEDLDLLEKAASNATITLPQEPRWPVSNQDWQYLLSSSNAIRGLAAARAGQDESTMRYLEDARVSLRSGDPTQPQINLIHRIAQARADFAVLELFGNRGKGFPKNKRSMVQEAAESITACIEELEDARYGSQRQRQLLLAAAEIDLVRIDLKSRFFRSQNDRDYSTAESFLLSAGARLEAFEDLDSAWWTQYLRLEGNRILLKTRGLREVSKTRQHMTAVEEIQRLQALQESATAYLEQPNNEDRYRNCIYFELGICLGNTADLLDALPEDVQVDYRIAEEHLREQAIGYLNRVAHESRTARHLENLALNYGQLFFTSIDQAIKENQWEEKQPDIQRRATAFQTVLGDPFQANVGQLRDSWRAALAIYFKMKTSDEVNSFLADESSRISLNDKATLNTLREKVNQLRE